MREKWEKGGSLGNYCSNYEAMAGCCVDMHVEVVKVVKFTTSRWLLCGRVGSGVLVASPNEPSEDNKRG